MLSPLAGVTDKIFRKLVRRWAPNSLFFTEMINASSLKLGFGTQKIKLLKGISNGVIIVWAGQPNLRISAAAGEDNPGDRSAGRDWSTYWHAGRRAAVWGLPKGSDELGRWSVCSQAWLAGKNDHQAE